MKILFVGDIYFSPYRKNQKFEITEDIRQIFNECDSVCINLEGPIINNNCKKIEKVGPAIFQKGNLFSSVLDNSKIIYNLANNHIFDYGEEGLKNTIEEIGENYLGAGANGNAYSPFIVASNKKIALISVAEAGFGVAKYELEDVGYAWFNDNRVFENIRICKEKSDYVVMIVHAGLEDVNIPLPEIRNLYRKYIDEGADLVIAHHPHVIQGMEEYKNGKIYYSLGNCIFDKTDGIGEYNKDSIGVIVDFEDKIETREVPLEYKNGKLGFGNEANILFKVANEALNAKSYMRDITDVCRKYYEMYYRMYYKGINGRNNRLYNMVKAIQYLLGMNCFNDNMVYHNLEIETHYWTTIRGLNEVLKDKRK